MPVEVAPDGASPTCGECGCRTNPQCPVVRPTSSIIPAPPGGGFSRFPLSPAPARLPGQTRHGLFEGDGRAIGGRGVTRGRGPAARLPLLFFGVRAYRRGGGNPVCDGCGGVPGW